MALWRDPLDELIGELDRTLPGRAKPAGFDLLPPLEDLQLAIHVGLYGTAEDLARAEQNPRIRALIRP